MPKPVTALAATISAPSGLRPWQDEVLAQMASWEEGTFLISAAPGAGKTRPALEFARRELAAGRISSVVIACPTAPLTRQWARAAHHAGLNLAPDADSPKPPSGFHGVAVTFARIAKSPRRWAGAMTARTLVVADEAHHLGEELAWGESFSTAFVQARRWLLLSGTPFRSDATPIPGIQYDTDGLAEPDYSYSYADSVRDGICRPVRFVAFDGTLSWRSGDDVIEAGFDTVLTSREASRRYRTAISTELPDGLPRILRQADERLQAVRRDGHRDAGGLVIAADSEHARQIASLLKDATGQTPVVVLHAEVRAAARLTAFTHSTEPWIVAVNMVSEGVDIPRLRVGVYATAAKTPLVFRQIVGRFVRTGSGGTGGETDPSWLYVPADPVLRDHASTIETELRQGRRKEREDEIGELDRPERQQTERGEAIDFVPLSAEMAPQMTLFGPPAAPAPAPARATSPAPAAPAAPVVRLPPPPPEVPAFERRARLRDERHRLVSEVSKRDRTSHREVNSWVNRKVGVESVDKATLEQLERSVELLMGKLTPRRRG